MHYNLKCPQPRRTRYVETRDRWHPEFDPETDTLKVEKETSGSWTFYIDGEGNRNPVMRVYNREMASMVACSQMMTEKITEALEVMEGMPAAGNRFTKANATLCERSATQIATVLAVMAETVLIPHKTIRRSYQPYQGPGCPGA